MSTATQPLVVPRTSALTLARDYAELAKLRVTTLIIMTAWCGYYFGALKSGVSSLSWSLFHTLVGIGLVSGGAAALNEVMEWDTDSRMRRTAQRPIPAGRFGFVHATLIGVLMTLGGALYLGLALNPLTAWLALATSAVYLGAYTPLKKVHPICTLVGAFPGAMPGVLGWTAARGRLEWGALVMFAIVFFWQFPHFYSIAWLYRQDYEDGGIRMLPVVESDGKSTGRQILIYSLALIPISLLPAFLGMSGKLYLAGALLLGIALLYVGWRLATLKVAPDYGAIQTAGTTAFAGYGSLFAAAVRADDAQPQVVTSRIHDPTGASKPSTARQFQIKYLVVSKAPDYVALDPQNSAVPAIPAVISVQDLVHRYEGRTALNGVSFDVRHAELFGLLGPNGSGKTTMFRILSTLMVAGGGRAVNYGI